jgi:hypothetical protein
LAAQFTKQVKRALVSADILLSMTTLSHIDSGVPAERTFSSNSNGLVAPAARSGVWTRLAVTWHAAVNYLVPIGYEDESGFHYGKIPASNAATSLGQRDANLKM